MQELKLCTPMEEGSRGCWGPGQGRLLGYTPAEPLSGHSRDRSDTREGWGRKKEGAREKEPRLRIWRGEGVSSTCPSHCRSQVGDLGDPRLRGWQRGGRGVWQEGTGGGGETLFTLALPMFSRGPSSCSQKLGLSGRLWKAFSLILKMRCTCRRCRCTRGFDVVCTMTHSCAGGSPPARSMAAPLPREGGSPKCHPGPGAGGSPAPVPGAQATPPAPCGAPPASAGSRGLADPPAAAPAPVLPSSSLRRRLPRRSLPARGCSRGWDRSGSRRPSLRPQPSPSTTPPAPPGRTPPSARPLTGRGRTREGERGGREGAGRVLEASAFHPSFGP